MNNYWDDRDYRQMADVRRNGRWIEVVFRNGDTVRIAPKQLIPWGDVDDWSVSLNDPYELAIQTGSETTEVPSSRIRVLTDRAYAQYLSEQTRRQAERIGGRLRQLREARGLTAKEVAQRAGINPVSLSRIETGKHEVVFSTLQAILTAMGYDLRDLTERLPALT